MVDGRILCRLTDEHNAGGGNSRVGSLLDDDSDGGHDINDNKILNPNETSTILFRINFSMFLFKICSPSPAPPFRDAGLCIRIQPLLCKRINT